MERDYAALDHLPLPSGSRVASPPPLPRLALESPAVEAMTDLRLVAASTIATDRTIEECKAIMVARAIRLLFVEDAQCRVLGVITATDLLGEKPVRFMHERSLRRHEILVSDLMTPASALEALDLQAVVHAQVGHIVATLKRAGRQHTFVTDEGGRRICGLFSATHIARRLGIEVATHEVAASFAEIEAALAR
jgi:CBS-domain-containing membrane protein